MSLILGKNKINFNHLHFKMITSLRIVQIYQWVMNLALIKIHWQITINNVKLNLNTTLKLKIKLVINQLKHHLLQSHLLLVITIIQAPLTTMDSFLNLSFNNNSNNISLNLNLNLNNHSRNPKALKNQNNKSQDNNKKINSNFQEIITLMATHLMLQVQQDIQAILVLHLLLHHRLAVDSQIKI